MSNTALNVVAIAIPYLTVVTESRILHCTNIFLKLSCVIHGSESLSMDGKYDQVEAKCL